MWFKAELKVPFRGFRGEEGAGEAEKQLHEILLETFRFE